MYEILSTSHLLEWIHFVPQILLKLNPVKSTGFKTYKTTTDIGWPAPGYRRARRWPAGWRCAAWRWAWVWRGRRTPAPAVTPCCTRPGWHHGACAAASGSTSASAPLECPVLQSNTHSPVRLETTYPNQQDHSRGQNIPWIISLILLQIPAAKSLWGKKIQWTWQALFPGLLELTRNIKHCCYLK